MQGDMPQIAELNWLIQNKNFNLPQENAELTCYVFWCNSMLHLTIALYGAVPCGEGMEKTSPLQLSFF